MAPLLKLAAWGSTKVTVIEGRIGTLERALDNDITGRRVVAQIVNDIAVIMSEIAEVRQALRYTANQFDSACCKARNRVSGNCLLACRGRKMTNSISQSFKKVLAVCCGKKIADSIQPPG